MTRRRSGVLPVALLIVAGWGIGTDTGRTAFGGLLRGTPAAAAGPAAAVPGRAACPVPGARFTSPYGARWGAFHDGIDLAAPIGTPIRAVLGGTVTFSAKADPHGFGQYVDVSSPAGTQRYGHMSRRLVVVGDRVHAGQVIALVGQEGRSTGPHLHLRVYPGAPSGRGVDPVPWLRARGVTVPCGGA